MPTSPGPKILFFDQGKAEMIRLEQRIKKMEIKVQGKPDHRTISEIHRVIINDDGTPAQNEDGSPYDLHH